MGCKYHRTNIGFCCDHIPKEDRIPFYCCHYKQQDRYHFCTLPIYSVKPKGCTAKDNELIREQMDYHSFNLEALQNKLMSL